MKYSAITIAFVLAVVIAVFVLSTALCVGNLIYGFDTCRLISADLVNSTFVPIAFLGLLLSCLVGVLVILIVVILELRTRFHQHGK
ncbi:MAG: hypothetical protein AAF429_08410 [Pseudomonadota bacterium]